MRYAPMVSDHKTTLWPWNPNSVPPFRGDSSTLSPWLLLVAFTRSPPKKKNLDDRGAALCTDTTRLSLSIDSPCFAHSFGAVFPRGVHFWFSVVHKPASANGKGEAAGALVKAKRKRRIWAWIWSVKQPLGVRACWCGGSVIEEYFLFFPFLFVLALATTKPLPGTASCQGALPLVLGH